MSVIPPNRVYAEAVNIDEQMAAASILLDLTHEGLSDQPGWADEDPRQQALDAAVAAVRRVIGATVQAAPPNQARVLGVALASCLGDCVGQLLKGLPDVVVQRALNEHYQRLLLAIGADPTRSGVDITTSSGQRENLN